MRRTAIVLGLILLAPTSMAQQSPNYSLSDYSFGSGGAFALESPTYRMTLVTTGELAAGATLESESYIAGAGFGTCYPPPGETFGLRFTGPQTLAWDAEPSTGVYNVYRELLTALASPTWGRCWVAGTAPTETTDATNPPAGDGYFYLVTAENLLAEEGPFGPDSSGIERPNLNPCN